MGNIKKSKEEDTFIKDLNNSVERVKSYFDIKVSKIFDNAKIS